MRKISHDTMIDIPLSTLINNTIEVGFKFIKP
jgi:hypothetical protein